MVALVISLTISLNVHLECSCVHPEQVPLIISFSLTEASVQFFRLILFSSCFLIAACCGSCVSPQVKDTFQWLVINFILFPSDHMKTYNTL